MSHNEKEDSLITITESELRDINIIFLEHSKLLKQNEVLNSQILKLEDVIVGYNQIDSLRIKEQNILNGIIEQQAKDNKKLNKKLKRRKTVSNIFIILSAILSTFIIVDAL